ncbi:MAG: hypothetical protein AAGG07_13705 [Planctomycetota bacterium]
MAEETLREITEADIEGLPRRAVVAFAARCARRVRPLFDPERKLDPKHHKAVEHAIAVAESIASGDHIASALAALSSARAATRAAEEAVTEAYLESAEVAAEQAAEAAVFSSEAISFAVDAVDALIVAKANNAVAAADVARSARIAAVRAGLAATPASAAALCDLGLLRSYAVEQGWTEDSDVVVPPEFFGPMWQDGEPEGWPEPFPKIPEASNVELSRLPRWARLAFAVRCLDRLSLSTRIRSDMQAFDDSDILDFADSASIRGRLAASSGRYQPTTVLQASMFGESPAAVLNQVSALVAVYNNQGNLPDDKAAKLIELCITFDARLEASILADLNLLARLSRDLFWTDGTPVDPALLGPLWSTGRPDGYLSSEGEEPSGDTTVPITLEFPEGTPREEISDAIVEMLKRLRRVHRVHGGSGVTLAEVEATCPAGVRVPSEVS